MSSTGKGKGKKGGFGGAQRHRKVLRDNIQGITKPAIRRLAHAGGVPRLSALVYEETRDVLKVYLENLIRDAVTYMEHGRRNTLSSEDFKMAYEKVTGRKFYGMAPDKRCTFYKATSLKGGKKRSPGKLAVKKIAYYQKQSDCFMIGKAGFNRLTREIAQEFKHDLRFSDNFLNMVHISSESYLKGLFKDCFLAAHSAGRTTIYPKDLQLVRRIRGERS
jgi:histone H4